MNTKPQTRYLFAGGCALVMLGLAAWHYQTRTSPAAVTQAAKIKVGQLNEAPTATAATSGANIDKFTATPDSVQAKKPRRKLIGSNGILNSGGKQSYQIEILYLVESLHLDLTEDETDRVQTAYETMYKSRQRLEAELATVEKVDDLHYRIIIPAYPNAGENLKTIFQNEVTGILGAQRTDKFLNKAALNLATVNGGWGVADQILDIKLVPQAKIYEIAHGFGLPEPKGISNFVGTSGSALSRDNLEPYQHLEKFFPTFPTN